MCTYMYIYVYEYVFMLKSNTPGDSIYRKLIASNI